MKQVGPRHLGSCSSWPLCVGSCVPCTVREPGFSGSKWCLGHWAPSSWIFCVGNPAQFGNLTSHARCFGSWAPSSWILCVDNPAQFGNRTSHATGGVLEVALLAVGLSVWAHAYPTQFGDLTSHATAGLSEVWLLAVGFSVRATLHSLGTLLLVQQVVSRKLGS